MSTISLITVAIVASTTLPLWLVKSANGAPNTPPLSPAAGKFCQHCGKPLQADWKACPY